MDAGEEELLNPRGEIFICWKGLERSVRVAAAMNSIGLEAKHVIGGTNQLKHHSDEEILRFIPAGAHVTIIYD